ncbi:MAG: heparan-alpha-glucosaminide N-acetyltransferase domain-containing protein, partial [Planctomycetota bacterium]
MALARCLTAPASAPEVAIASAPAAATTTAAVARTTIVQMVFLLALLAAAAATAWLAGFVVVPWATARFSLGALVFVAPWLAAIAFGVWTVGALWLAVAAKELLIGRYRPGRFPAWSSFHLRHWLVARLVRLVPWSLLDGTEAKNAALRLLGARIGARVHIHRGVDLFGGGWDLLELGDDVTLQREVDLGLCELDGGALVVGAVRIAAGATLATRAGAGPGVEIGAGSIVRPLAFVREDALVGPGEVWDGVPARPVGRVQPVVASTTRRGALRPWTYTVVLLAARILWAPLVALPFTSAAWLLATQAGIEANAVTAWLCGDGPSSQPSWVWLMVAMACAALPVSLLGQALLLRWGPKVAVGAHDRWSAMHLRLQVRGDLLEAAGTWLSGTLFWPVWLRLAGMRVGSDCEVSTILDTLPEHVGIGSGSFLADGIYLGVPWQHQGVVTVAPCVLGARTFAGNHAVIHGGQSLPDDLLLGVSTVADANTMAAGGGWFGQPAFALPRREVVAADRRLTHEPGPLRYTNRLFWESLRFLLPALPVWLALWWFDVVAAAPAAALVVAIFATLACGAALAAAVLALKWLLLGRVRPGQHGLWSCWASRWDFHYVVWQRYGRALLQQLEGTLLLPWFLRAMGMRIGRRCLLGDGFAQVVDPDMLTIGDGATVHALFQAHSFEDRVLKIDRVRIAAGATVGRGTVVLYGAEIQERARVLPHGVVMKHELLLAGRAYVGAPTAEEHGAAGVVAEAPGAPLAPAPATARELAFDAGRGLAVLGMLWLHFVPEPGDDDRSIAAAFAGWTLQALEGVPASLFVLLGGAAWVCAGRSTSEQVELRLAFVFRRALALTALGVPFWVWAWPNDVLVPMALALALTAPLLRAGRGALVAAAVALLLATPFAAELGHDWLALDLRDDDTHAANHTFGWCTLRWYLFDGAYPLLPWLVLPLFGALLALSARGDCARWRRWLLLALPLPFVAHGLAAGSTAAADDLGALAPHLQIAWQPTTLP